MCRARLLLARRDTHKKGAKRLVDLVWRVSFPNSSRTSGVLEAVRGIWESLGFGLTPYTRDTIWTGGDDMLVCSE